MAYGLPINNSGGGGFGGLNSPVNLGGLGMTSAINMGNGGGTMYGSEVGGDAIRFGSGMWNAAANTDNQGGDFWGRLGHQWAQTTHGPQAPSLNPFQAIGPGNQVSGPGTPDQITAPDLNKNLSPYDQAFQSQQAGLANHLMQQATGQGPSIADMQARQAMQQNIAGQFGLANSARGGQQSLALRNAMNNAGAGNAQLGMQSAMGRLAEQQQAANTLGGVLQGARGQDLEQAINQGQMSLGAAQANQNAGTQYAQMGINAQNMNAQNYLNYENLGMQQNSLQNQQLLQKYQIQNGAFGSGMMAGGSALAALAAMA